MAGRDGEERGGRDRCYFYVLGTPRLQIHKKVVDVKKRKSAGYRYKTEFPQTRNVLDSDRSDLLATGATCPMFPHPPGLSHRQEVRMKPWCREDGERQSRNEGLPAVGSDSCFQNNMGSHLASRNV